MEILIIGDTESLNELKNHAIMSLSPDTINIDQTSADFGDRNLTEKLKSFKKYDVVLNLNYEGNPNVYLKEFIDLGASVIIVDGTEGIIYDNLSAYFVGQELTNHVNIFGLNILRGFLDKPVWEMSSINKLTQEQAELILQPLNIKFKLVEDRVGMVTPRVISMIINEAYWMLQEKTATRQDINNAMKLGTNYPFGPFEWVEKLGIRRIEKLLELMKAQYGERYLVCPLLKHEAAIRYVEYYNTIHERNA